ncbi:hypothetical protein CBW46_009185 [Paenibacillus xerothermodurans]|uniref:Uncharacterized protein n=1 Tax=Paenibacillus xerothermodurans TaxID=1977292 RepID=A0A2W1NEI9_PAEXE|nr:hypothetical protein CBW46_009185 [Paenibacillus xerothermodurans]
MRHHNGWVAYSELKRVYLASSLVFLKLIVYKVLLPHVVTPDAAAAWAAAWSAGRAAAAVGMPATE